MQTPKYYREVLTLLLIIVSFQLSAQIETNTNLYRKFDLYRQSNLQEKLYIKTDRSSYLVGETIWFSVTVVDGTLHHPLALSKIAYVEIINQENQSLLHAKIELNEGRSEGALYIPASLASGNYQLRGYTNWMKNFSSDFFFQNTISIYNTFSAEVPKLEKNPTTPLYASFLPEGGTFVEEIANTIGFRVTNHHGKGESFKGTVINQQGDTVVRFTPLQHGIGRFEFTPKHDNLYTAIIKGEDGKLSKYTLPKAEERGYTLRLSETDTQIDLNIHGVGIENPNFQLFIHARNQLVQASNNFLKQGQQNISLQKSSLPEGIIHITLFDAFENPVCERLFFNRPKSSLRILAHSETESTLTRRKVTLDLATSVGHESKPANLVVSVYKADSLGVNDMNIANYLWLSSDLTGTIENVQSYFEPNANSFAMDNLMLTHGWRRFTWTDIKNTSGLDTLKKHMPEYRGHIVNGHVKDERGNPAPSILTYLSSPEKSIRIYGARSNEDGKVMYEMQNFYGSTGVIAQMNPTRDSTYQIEIASPFYDHYEKLTLPPFTVPKHYAKNMLDRSIAMQVQDIYYRDETEKLRNTPRDTTAFYNVGDNVYYLDNYTRFPVMEEVLREYVPGVLVRKRRDGYHFIVLDDVRGSAFHTTSLMLLDGIPIFDADEIMAIDPLKIKKLEVIRREYFLGIYSFPGIISFSTYTNDLAGIPLHPKSIKSQYEGLQLKREFYSPAYEGPKQRESKMPDQRTLLYWDANYKTDENGKGKINFYTSDVPGNYIVVVEGLTETGQPGYSVTSFEVKD